MLVCISASLLSISVFVANKETGYKVYYFPVTNKYYMPFTFSVLGTRSTFLVVVMFFCLLD